MCRRSAATARIRFSRLFFSAALATLGLCWLGPSRLAAQQALLSDEIQEQVQRAGEAFFAGRFDEALAEFEKAVTDAKSYKPVTEDYLRQAAIAFGEDDFEAALKAADEALKSSTTPNADAQFTRGMILKSRRKQGDFALAAAAFEAALAIDPAHRRAAGELYELWSEQQNYAPLIARLKACLDKAPNDPFLLYYLGRTYHLEGDQDRAIQTLTDAVRYDKGDATAQIALFEALAEGGAQALEVFEQLAAEDPPPMLKMALAEVYIREDRIEQAMPILDELAKSESDVVSAAMLQQIAANYAQAKRFEDAIKVAGRVRRQSKPGTEQYYRVVSSIGEWQIEVERPDEAITSLNDALQTYQQFGTEKPAKTLFLLGRAYHKKGNQAQAELYFRQYLDAASSRFDFDTLALLGDIYESEGNYSRATEHYGEAIAAVRQYQPTSETDAFLIGCRLKLAKAYFSQGRALPTMYEKCIAEAGDLVTKLETRGPATILLSRAFLQTNQAARAESSLRTIEGASDWTDEADSVMGDALMAQKKNDAALPYIERARQAKPDDETRTLQLARIEGLLGRHADAQKIYDEVLTRKPGMVPALVGLGELKLAMAQSLPAEERIAPLTDAVARLKQASDAAQSDAEIRSKLGNAERALSTAQAEVDAERERLKTIAWTIACVVGAAVVVAAIFIPLWWILRRLAKERLLQKVLELEAQLAGAIRRECRRKYGDGWQKTLASDNRLKERAPISWLAERALETGKEDALAAANFGHLVALLDEQWKPLFAHRVRHNTPLTKQLVISNLNYISACRNARLAHAADDSPDATARGAAARHMDRQVRISLKLVYENLNLQEHVHTPLESTVSMTTI